jgi:hypothetical protein
MLEAFAQANPFAFLGAVVLVIAFGLAFVSAR